MNSGGVCFYFLDFLKVIFNWGIIALQCCVGFCRTAMRVSLEYTYVPFLLNLPPLPTSLPLGCSRALS